MEPSLRQCADRARDLLVSGKLLPTRFRALLDAVPARDRDTWVDRLLGLEELPEDGPELPRGCAPYLPCSVDAIVCAIDAAGICDSDQFVDVGSGIGRVGLLVRLLTGASVVGIEVQPHLVESAYASARRLGVEHFGVVSGDAVELARFMMLGSVFFLYCPFSGARLEWLVDGLEPIARLRPLRVCSVDLSLPSRSWLSKEATLGHGVRLVRSHAHRRLTPIREGNLESSS